MTWLVKSTRAKIILLLSHLSRRSLFVHRGTFVFFFFFFFFSSLPHALTKAALLCVHSLSFFLFHMAGARTHAQTHKARAASIQLSSDA